MGGEVGGGGEMIHVRRTQWERKGGGEKKNEKKGKKQTRQDSLNSLFMCLPLHLDCTAELLPSAPGLGEAENAKQQGNGCRWKREEFASRV